MSTYKAVISVLLLLFASTVQCGSPKPVDDAFTLRAYVANDGQVVVQFLIANGYQLYADQFKVAHVDGTPVSFTVNGDPVTLYDPFEKLNREHYLHTVQLEVGADYTDFAQGLLVRYQGCLPKVLCYLPQTRIFELESRQFTSL